MKVNSICDRSNREWYEKEVLMEKEKYVSHKEQVEKELKRLENKLDQIGYLRVGSFLLVVISIVVGFELKNTWYYLIGGLFLLLFIKLVIYYNQLKGEKQYEIAKKEVIETYINRLGREWLDFKEDGASFRDEAIPRTKDLDLLGKGSLFQYLCVGHTPYGKEALAKVLIHGVKQEQIPRRQEAVKELLKDDVFRLHLQTLSQMIGKNEEGIELQTIETFVRLAEVKSKKQSRLVKSLALILPFIVIFWGVLVILQRATPLINLIGSLGIVAQMGLSIFYYSRHQMIFDPIIKFSQNIKAYEAFLYAIENKDFKCEYLKDLQVSLCKQGGPKKALKGLKRLTEALKVRCNGVGYMIVGSTLMWDFHCMDVYNIWQKQYGNTIRSWLKVMGEMEALLSLAVIGEVKETTIFPEIKQEEVPYMSFSNLKHPLLQEQRAVGNALELSNATCIITGSNMSGKTTFLRTIGINLALAYAGAPVLATHFVASRMEVLTSMRIEDNVNEGISTFYAELLRIKQMITKSEYKKPMLVLIDEIFKGTNSADRILGATETIHALEKPWITVMVSTHDFELCELENNDKRATYNYHFTEHYQDNKIKFDYKLQKGRCKTTNAKYLLKMVGIIK